MMKDDEEMTLQELKRLFIHASQKHLGDYSEEAQHSLLHAVAKFVIQQADEEEELNAQMTECSEMPQDLKDLLMKKMKRDMGIKEESNPVKEQIDKFEKILALMKEAAGEN